MSALKPQQSQFASKVAGKERGGEEACPWHKMI